MYQQQLQDIALKARPYSVSSINSVAKILSSKEAVLAFLTIFGSQIYADDSQSAKVLEQGKRLAEGLEKLKGRFEELRTKSTQYELKNALKELIKEQERVLNQIHEDFEQSNQEKLSPEKIQEHTKKVDELIKKTENQISETNVEQNHEQNTTQEQKPVTETKQEAKKSESELLEQEIEKQEKTVTNLEKKITQELENIKIKQEQVKQKQARPEKEVKKEPIKEKINKQAIEDLKQELKESLEQGLKQQQQEENNKEDASRPKENPFLLMLEMLNELGGDSDDVLDILEMIEKLDKKDNSSPKKKESRGKVNKSFNKLLSEIMKRGGNSSKLYRKLSKQESNVIDAGDIDINHDVAINSYGNIELFRLDNCKGMYFIRAIYNFINLKHGKTPELKCEKLVKLNGDLSKATDNYSFEGVKGKNDIVIAHDKQIVNIVPRDKSVSLTLKTTEKGNNAYQLNLSSDTKVDVYLKPKEKKQEINYVVRQEDYLRAKETLPTEEKALIDAIVKAFPNLEDQIFAILTQISAKKFYYSNNKVTNQALKDARERGEYDKYSVSINAGDCDYLCHRNIMLFAYAGIPVRMVVGFFNQNNDKSLLSGEGHAWLEYKGKIYDVVKREFSKINPWRSYERLGLVDDKMAQKIHEYFLKQAKLNNKKNDKALEVFKSETEIFDLNKTDELFWKKQVEKNYAQLSTQKNEGFKKLYETIDKFIEDRQLIDAAKIIKYSSDYGFDWEFKFDKLSKLEKSILAKKFSVAFLAKKLTESELKHFSEKILYSYKKILKCLDENDRVALIKKIVSNAQPEMAEALVRQIMREWGREINSKQLTIPISKVQDLFLDFLRRKKVFNYYFYDDEINCITSTEKLSGLQEEYRRFLRKSIPFVFNKLLAGEREQLKKYPPEWRSFLEDIGIEDVPLAYKQPDTFKHIFEYVGRNLRLNGSELDDSFIYWGQFYEEYLKLVPFIDSETKGSLDLSFLAKDLEYDKNELITKMNKYLTEHILRHPNSAQSYYPLIKNRLLQQYPKNLQAPLEAIIRTICQNNELITEFEDIFMYKSLEESCSYFLNGLGVSLEDSSLDFTEAEFQELAKKLNHRLRDYHSPSENIEYYGVKFKKDYRVEDIIKDIMGDKLSPIPSLVRFNSPQELNDYENLISDLIEIYNSGYNARVSGIINKLFENGLKLDYEALTKEEIQEKQERFIEDFIALLSYIAQKTNFDDSRIDKPSDIVKNLYKSDSSLSEEAEAIGKFAQKYKLEAGSVEKIDSFNCRVKASKNFNVTQLVYSLMYNHPKLVNHFIKNLNYINRPLSSDNLKIRHFKAHSMSDINPTEEIQRVIDANPSEAIFSLDELVNMKSINEFEDIVNLTKNFNYNADISSLKKQINQARIVKQYRNNKNTQATNIIQEGKLIQRLLDKVVFPNSSVARLLQNKVYLPALYEKPQQELVQKLSDLQLDTAIYQKKELYKQELYRIASFLIDGKNINLEEFTNDLNKAIDKHLDSQKITREIQAKYSNISGFGLVNNAWYLCEKKLDIYELEELKPNLKTLNEELQDFVDLYQGTNVFKLKNADNFKQDLEQSLSQIATEISDSYKPNLKTIVEKDLLYDFALVAPDSFAKLSLKEQQILKDLHELRAPYILPNSRWAKYAEIESKLLDIYLEAGICSSQDHYQAVNTFSEKLARLANNMQGDYMLLHGTQHLNSFGANSDETHYFKNLTTTEPIIYENYGDKDLAKSFNELIFENYERKSSEIQEELFQNFASVNLINRVDFMESFQYDLKHNSDLIAQVLNISRSLTSQDLPYVDRAKHSIPQLIEPMSKLKVFKRCANFTAADSSKYMTKGSKEYDFVTSLHDYIVHYFLFSKENIKHQKQLAEKINQDIANFYKKHPNIKKLSMKQMRDMLPNDLGFKSLRFLNREDILTLDVMDIYQMSTDDRAGLEEFYDIRDILLASNYDPQAHNYDYKLLKFIDNLREKNNISNFTNKSLLEDLQRDFEKIHKLTDIYGENYVRSFYEFHDDFNLEQVHKAKEKLFLLDIDKHKVKAIENLNKRYSQYLDINWTKFEPIFNSVKSELKQLLSKINVHRNNIRIYESRYSQEELDITRSLIESFSKAFAKQHPEIFSEQAQIYNTPAAFLNASSMITVDNLISYYEARGKIEESYSLDGFKDKQAKRLQIDTLVENATSKYSDFLDKFLSPNGSYKLKGSDVVKIFEHNRLVNDRYILPHQIPDSDRDKPIATAYNKLFLTVNKQTEEDRERLLKTEKLIGDSLTNSNIYIERSDLSGYMPKVLKSDKALIQEANKLKAEFRKQHNLPTAFAFAADYAKEDRAVIQELMRIYAFALANHPNDSKKIKLNMATIEHFNQRLEALYEAAGLRESKANTSVKAKINNTLSRIKHIFNIQRGFAAESSSKFVTDATTFYNDTKDKASWWQNALAKRWDQVHDYYNKDIDENFESQIFTYLNTRVNKLEKLTNKLNIVDGRPVTSSVSELLIDALKSIPNDLFLILIIIYLMRMASLGRSRKKKPMQAMLEVLKKANLNTNNSSIKKLTSKVSEIDELLNSPNALNGDRKMVSGRYKKLLNEFLTSLEPVSYKLKQQMVSALISGFDSQEIKQIKDHIPLANLFPRTSSSYYKRRSLKSSAKGLEKTINDAEKYKENNVDSEIKKIVDKYNQQKPIGLNQAAEQMAVNVKEIMDKYNLSDLARKLGMKEKDIKKSLIGLNGIELDALREYVAGDDIKYVDWKAYGRSNTYYVKDFEKEEMTPNEAPKVLDSELLLESYYGQLELAFRLKLIEAKVKAGLVSEVYLPLVYKNQHIDILNAQEFYKSSNGAVAYQLVDGIASKIKAKKDYLKSKYKPTYNYDAKQYQSSAEKELYRETILAAEKSTVLSTKWDTNDLIQTLTKLRHELVKKFNLKEKILEVDLVGFNSYEDTDKLFTEAGMKKKKTI